MLELLIFVGLIFLLFKAFGMPGSSLDDFQEFSKRKFKNALSKENFRFIEDDRELQRPDPEPDRNWPPIYAARENLQFSELAERVVVDAVTDIVKDEPHHVMQNVTLGLKNGGSSQIDVVLFSKRGVFVIEVKAFRGTITGNADDEYWTQSKAFDRREFRNPIRQNHSHLYALEERIGIPMDHMHSLVIFGREGRFKEAIADNVIKLSQLKDFINSKEPNMLTEQELTQLIGKTELMRLPQCQETDDKHVEYVKTKAARAD